MNAIKVTLGFILFLMMALSIWFYSKIKTLKEQLTTTKSNSLTASLSTTTNDLEKRVKKIEDCFED